jgi:S-adenosylmethionine decarboxylase proenzyme
LRALCVTAAEKAGLTVVGDRFFQFEPQGVTGTVLLAESHLAIHTWPEEGFVTVDVYVCNYTTDNTGKAERLFAQLEAALKPARKRFQAIRRGGRDD